MISGSKRNQPKPRKLTKKRAPSTKPPAELWVARRAGARNVAGVRFQLRLTLTLLVRLAHSQFPATALRPEGMEDIDTVPVAGEQHRYLQAKEIADDTRFMGIGALADFLEHVTPLLRLDDDAIATLVTNGKFGGGLEATGWDECFTPSADVVQTIADAMEGVPADEIERLLRRVQLVEEPADVGVLAHELGERHQIDPAVAQIALDRCLATVLDTAADQAGTSLPAPVALTLSDLDEAVAAAKRAIATAGLSVDEFHRVASALTFRTRSELNEEQFLNGVDVKPEHIAANLDVPRTDHLDEIARGLESDRLVLVVGPSGAGKSALLWRAANEHAERMRVWRVNELSEADADILISAVEQQQPSARLPLLVCVDDIGRANRTGWRKAASALLDLPGVYIVGAAREEDFATEDALRRALIVRPNLDRRTARQIDRVLRERGVTPVMAVDEALPRARGLLMEFLHLITAGRRLASVLSEQAAALEEPARHKALAVARYVTAAHRVGLDASAPTLEARFHGADLPSALRRLEREHLLVASASGTWTGLHELRSTELSNRLHDRPPPRLADTLALVLQDTAPHDAAARLPAIVRAAATGPEPIATALAIRVRTAGADESADWLEGARLADIAEHARACADVARKLPLPAGTNLVQFLFMAHSSRFAGVDLSILPEQFHAHAARLPSPHSDLHQETASTVHPDEWIERALLAEPAARVRLIEALEQGVSWSESAATRLAGATSTERTDINARLVASIHRGCADDTARAAFLEALPSPDRRLQALQDYWPLLTDAVFDAPSGTVRTRFISPIDGDESPERQAADLAAIVLDLLPETKIVEVTVTRYDGADLALHGKLGPHKAIPRENHPSQVVTRWNRAFHDATEREFASASLTLRLREQASAVSLARDVVLGALERVLRFDADDREKRRWATRAEQLERDVAKLKGMPSAGLLALATLGSMPRSSGDMAARALQTTASAMSQLSEASLASHPDERQQQMRLVGSRLRDAAGQYRAAVEEGSARLSGEANPLDPVLAEVLDDVASCLIGYADGATLRSGGRRVTLDDLRSAGQDLRHHQRQIERDLIAETLSHLPGLDVNPAQLVHATDRPMPVAEPRRWLVQVPPTELAVAAEALLSVVRAATISHPLAFRIIVAPAEHGALYSYPGLLVGRDNAFPVDVAEIQVLSIEAEVPMHPGRFVGETAECIEALVRSSRAARAARAMAGTAQAKPLSERAQRELERAREIIRTIEIDEVADPLRAVARSVAAETAGTAAGALAIEFDDALANGVIGPRLDSLEAASQAAALAT